MQSIADLSAEMAWGNNQAGIVGLNVVPVASMQPMHGQLSMHVPLTTGSALGPFSAHMSGHVAVHRPVSYLPVVPGNSGQLGPDLLPHDVALHDTALSLSGGFAQQAPAITASSLSGGYVLPPQPPQALFDLTNQPAWVDAAAPPTANSSDHAIAALLRAVTGLDLDSLPSANNVASSTVCSPIGTDNTVYGSQLSGVSGIDSDAAIGSWDMSSKAYSRPNSALSFGPVPSLQHHNLLSAASNRLVQARSGSLHNMAYGRSAKQQVQALHNAVAANGNLLPGSSRMASRPTSGNKVHGMHTSTAVSAGVSGLFDGNAVNQAMEAARQLLQASSTHRHTSSAPGSGNVVGAAPAAAATVPGGVTPLPAALVGTGLVPSAGSLTGDASTDCAVGGDGAVEEGRVDGPPGELASQQSYSRHKLYKVICDPVLQLAACNRLVSSTLFFVHLDNYYAFCPHTACRLAWLCFGICS